MSKRKISGFTLIEMMVVVAIIGILATLAIVSYRQTLKTSRDKKRVADIESVRLALNMYADKKGSYPSGNWSTLGNYLGDYLDIANIKDPLPTTYSYTYTPTGTGNNNCQLTYRSEVESGATKSVDCND
ncbi:MAG: prepilin-type N-terminal cleavage/methylation domain-containing protein [Patescibacteria group bacterium]|nr:prepilin-type N-terminal cleavage/methylation domain-containing protein [Patescibacteria group bacterium]